MEVQIYRCNGDADHQVGTITWNGRQCVAHPASDKMLRKLIEAPIQVRGKQLTQQDGEEGTHHENAV